MSTDCFVNKTNISDDDYDDDDDDDGDRILNLGF